MQIDMCLDVQAVHSSTVPDCISFYIYVCVTYIRKKQILQCIVNNMVIECSK